MNESRLKISLSSLAILISVILCLILLWHLRGLLVTLMIATVLAATLSPIVDYVERFLPRWLGVILAYLIIIAILVGGGLVIGPTVFTQLQRLIQKFPLYLEILGNTAENLVMRFGITEPRALELIDKLLDLQALISWGVRSSQKLLLSSLGVTKGIVGGVFNLILSILLSGYLLAGSDKLIKGFVRLFPSPWNQRIEAQFEPVTERMGKYIQGRILVSLVLGVAITIGLKILGINEFALGLGVIAGFTNLIPFFGPVLGSVPALIVAVAQGGWVFLWVLLLFLVIQNIETYVLDPLLVGSSVKVEPLYQLLAVLGGVQVLGIIGALIVPPWIAGAGVVLENLYIEPREKNDYLES
ncbi:AI-2E family transporter [Cyanobacterium stanieri LEGE 03274]|uniref:AI-2E family transporter n=1 Tax=Cyanobacterium stanieri LEGE 03274 TaxID=1828756 RepID=A0ABR9UZU3_9CHRO|nr:AI-2E family transporter [Cyanobacterium stanieri]MBE9221156.1 AI-2E family transporter [Cyanobacterium stanieri LEGE 03274]